VKLGSRSALRRPHLRGRTPACARQRHYNRQHGCTQQGNRGPLPPGSVTQRRSGPPPRQHQGPFPQPQRPLPQPQRPVPNFPKFLHHQRSSALPAQTAAKIADPRPRRHNTHPLLVPPPFQSQRTKVYTAMHRPPAEETNAADITGGTCLLHNNGPPLHYRQTQQTAVPCRHGLRPLHVSA
jgi:hypothetical protein